MTKPLRPTLMEFVTQTCALFWAGWFLWELLGFMGGHYSAILCGVLALTCDAEGMARGIGWGMVDIFLVISPLLIGIAAIAIRAEAKEQSGESR